MKEMFRLLVSLATALLVLAVAPPAFALTDCTLNPVTFKLAADCTTDSTITVVGGTTLDGDPLVQGRPMPLRDGSVIGLGPQVRIRFNLT